MRAALVLLSAFTLILVVVPVVARASDPGVEAVLLEERVEMGPSKNLEAVGTSKTWIAGRRIRIEEAGGAQLYDTDGGTFSVIRAAKKSFYQIARADLQAAGTVPPVLRVGLAIDDEGEPRVPRTLLKKTGRTARIEGRETVEWATTEEDVQGGFAHLWFARLADVRWSDLLDPVRDLFTAPGSRFSSYFEQAATIDGYPVRVEWRSATEDEVLRFTVTKIERRTVPASHFAPPPEFRRISDPAGLGR